MSRTEAAETHHQPKKIVKLLRKSAAIEFQCQRWPHQIYDLGTSQGFIKFVSSAAAVVAATQQNDDFDEVSAVIFLEFRQRKGTKKETKRHFSPQNLKVGNLRLHLTKLGRH